MRFHTHLAVALFLSLCYLNFIHAPAKLYQVLLFLAITILCALIPDIDATRSFMGRRFKIIAFFFEHRGFFHSGILGVLILCIFYVWFPNYIWASIFGYWSHIGLDALNKGGIRLFWPSKQKMRGPFLSGGITDKLLFLIFIFADVYLFLLL